MTYTVFKFLDRQARANHVDPDQMPHSVASDQDLHCLAFIQQFLDTYQQGVGWSC